MICSHNTTTPWQHAKSRVYLCVCAPCALFNAPACSLSWLGHKAAIACLALTNVNPRWARHPLAPAGTAPAVSSLRTARSHVLLGVIRHILAPISPGHCPQRRRQKQGDRKGVHSARETKPERYALSQNAAAALWKNGTGPKGQREESTEREGTQASLPKKRERTKKTAKPAKQMQARDCQERTVLEPPTQGSINGLSFVSHTSQKEVRFHNLSISIARVWDAVNIDLDIWMQSIKPYTVRGQIFLQN